MAILRNKSYGWLIIPQKGLKVAPKSDSDIKKGCIIVDDISKYQDLIDRGFLEIVPDIKEDNSEVKSFDETKSVNSNSEGSVESVKPVEANNTQPVEVVKPKKGRSKKS